jgi:HAE1 family hydrophobic/amphiphilic exporter-1
MRDATSEKREHQRAFRPYKILVLQVMKHKNSGIISFFLILGITAFLGLTTPREVLPQQQNSRGVLSVSLPRGYNFEKVSSAALDLTRTLKGELKPESLYMESGYDEENLKGRSEAGRSLQDLKIHIDHSVRRDDIKEILESRGTYIPEESFFESLLRGSINKGIKLIGSERDVLYRIQLPQGFKDQTDKNLPILQFESTRDSLSASGVTGIDLLRTLTADITGKSAGEILIQGNKEKVPVIVRASKEYRTSKEELLQIGFKQENGLIRLGQLGSLDRTLEFTEIYRSQRENMRPLMTLSRLGTEMKTGSFEKTLPEGVSLTRAEGSEGGQLIKLFLFALVLIYLILGIQSGSPGKAFLLFCSLPLSLPGSFLMLRIFNQTLNLYSFVGLLILQGTIVNTAILLISSYKNSTRAQVLISSTGRLRPVLATTLTTVTALIPIFISSWRRNDPNGAMALVVMGGMILGTFLIMVLIPSLYIRASLCDD